MVDNVVVGNTIMFSDRLGNGSLAKFDGCAIWAHTGDYVGFIPAAGDTAGVAWPNISRLLIANNNIWNPRGEGIWIGTSANGGTIDDVLLEGNIIHGDNATAQDATSAGINVSGASGDGTVRSQHYVSAVSFMTDITIRGNSIQEFAYYGIRLHGVSRATVDGNRVQQNGLTTNAAGISAEGCTDLSIRGNRSRNLSGTAQTHGIQLVTASGASMITENLVNGNPTGIVNTTPSGSTIYIWDNPGSSVTRAAPPN